MGGGSGRKADGRGCWLWRSRCQEGLQTRRSPSPPPPPRGVAIGIAIELPPPGRCAPLTRGEERTAGGRAASRSFRLHCCCCLCRRRRNHHRHSHRHRHNHRYRPALPAGRARKKCGVEGGGWVCAPRSRGAAAVAGAATGPDGTARHAKPGREGRGRGLGVKRSAAAPVDLTPLRGGERGHRERWWTGYEGAGGWTGWVGGGGGREMGARVGGLGERRRRKIPPPS